MRKAYFCIISGIVIAICAFLLISENTSAWSSGDTYPGSGNWNINNPTTVADEIITVTGNININNGGRLTLYNAGIRFQMSSDAQYTFTVNQGGKLYVYDSFITSTSGSYHYKFVIRDTTVINRSRISEMWGNTGNWDGGIQIYTSKCVIGNSTIFNGKTGGIYASKCAPYIYNNVIENNGRQGSNPYGYGIYCTGTTGIKIENNTIRYNHYVRVWGGWWWKRYYMYGYGVRIDSGSSKDSILNNTIIRNGFDTGSYRNYRYIYDNYGIYISSCSPTIKNNYLEDNGIYLTNCHSQKISGGYIVKMFGGSYTLDYGIRSGLYITSSGVSIKNMSFSYDLIYSIAYGWQIRDSICNFTDIVYECNRSYSWGSSNQYEAHISNSIVNITNSVIKEFKYARYGRGLYITGSIVNMKNVNITYTPSNSYSFNIIEHHGNILNITNSSIIFNPKGGSSSTSSTMSCIYTTNKVNIIGSKVIMDMDFNLSSHSINALRASGADVCISNRSLISAEYINSFSPGRTMEISSGKLKVVNSTIDVKIKNITGRSGKCEVIHISNVISDITGCIIKGYSSNANNIDIVLIETTGKNSKIKMVKCEMEMDMISAESAPAIMHFSGYIPEDAFSLENSIFKYYIRMNPNKTIDIISFENKGSPKFKNNKLYVYLSDDISSQVNCVMFRKALPNIDALNIEIIKNKSNSTVNGFYCDYGAGPRIMNSTIKNCTNGVYIDSFGHPIIRELTIENCKVGINIMEDGNTSCDRVAIKKCEIGVNMVSAYGTFYTSLFSQISAEKCILDYSSTAIFVNSSIEASSCKLIDDKSVMYVGWYIVVKCTWQNGVPNAKAKISFKDSIGNIIKTVETSSDGKTEKVIIFEYQLTKFGKTIYSPYTIIATKNGAEGKQSVSVDSSKEITVVITDDELPFIAIIKPEDGTHQNFTDVIVEGIVMDNVSGINLIEYSVDGGEKNALTNEKFTIKLNLDEGSHVIEFIASDIAGGTSKASVSIIIDLSLPEIKIESPQNGSWMNKINIHINGSTEPGSFVKINGVEVDENDGKFSMLWRLAEGKNDILIEATDLAGNHNSMILTIYLDITLPYLTIQSPRDGTITNKDKIDVIGITEPGATVTINGIEANVNNDGKFTGTISLQEGENNIKVIAIDHVGNEKVLHVKVIRDSEVLIEIYQPEDNTFTNSPLILISGKTDIDVKLTLNGMLIRIDESGRFTTTYTLREGENLLVFTGTDSAGNMLRLTIKVTLDSSIPIVTLEDIKDGMIVKNSTIVVKGKVEDAKTVFVNNKEVSLDENYFETEVDLIEGINIIEIILKDAVGNTKYVSIKVIRDTIPPHLEILEPTDGFRTREEIVDVIGITEPGAKVYVNGRPIKVDEFGKFSVTLTLTKKKMFINVTAIDSAGNVNSESIMVKKASSLSAVKETGWIWIVSGTLISIGLGFPLTVLTISYIMRMTRRRNLKEGLM